jgi:transketolase
MANETNIADLESLCVNALRFLAVDAVEKANSGHPGTPMEAAALGHVLWTKLLRHNPHNPVWANRDRFILSCGHASALLYGLLHLTGYPVTLDDLKQFRQWGSLTPGHPEHAHTAGVETTTGPLGQGFATGVGMAIAARHLAARFNRPDFPIVDHKRLGLRFRRRRHGGALLRGRLPRRPPAPRPPSSTFISTTASPSRGAPTSPSPRTSKPASSPRAGACFRLANAENLFEVRAVLEKALAENVQPTLVIARTHIGYGAPNKQDTAKAHGEPLGAAETLQAKQKLGWPTEPAFHVPPAVDFATGPRCASAARRPGESVERPCWPATGSAHPDLAAHWDAVSTKNGPLPAHWEKRRAGLRPGRRHGHPPGLGQNPQRPRQGPSLPSWADPPIWAPPTTAASKADRSFTAQTPEGRNLHFGIREHAMGAILNGLALSGRVIPYGATFLTFADYMRPAIRLAALMKLGVVYIFTHDSIGLGEDGPTHQPVEHLASLRAIPGLVVLRPADANETVQAWRVALERRDGPTALVLSRQKLPMVTTGKTSTFRGAYRLFGGDAEVLLYGHRIGSGVGREIARGFGGQRHSGRRRERAELGALLVPRRRPPRRGFAPGADRPRRDRGRRVLGVAPVRGR